MSEDGEQTKGDAGQAEDMVWTTIRIPSRVKALLDTVSEYHLKTYGKPLSQAEAIIEAFKAWEEKFSRQA